MLWCARLGLCSPSSPGSSPRGALQGLAMGQEDSLHLKPLGNGFVPPRIFAVLLGVLAPAPLSSVAVEGMGHSLDGERCWQRSLGSSEIEEAIAPLIRPVAPGLSAQANISVCF